MPEESTESIEISVSELNKLLELIEKTIDGLSKAVQIPKKQRDEIRKAVADTCEAIDSILLSVKHALDDIKEALEHDYPNAKDSISQLSNAGGWEEKYRQLKLCWPLRRATGELRETVLGKLKSMFSFNDPDELRKQLDMFLATEATAGEFVSRMLIKLSRLSNDVDTKKDSVITEIEKAQAIAHEYRQKFINMEIKIHRTL